MKSNNFFTGVELEGVIIEFFSPDEFYCSFIEENEYVKLSETNVDDASDVPTKNEVLKHKKFMLRLGDENILCDVVNDLKFDEVYCQVSLCNTSVQLKVNYQSLRHLHDGINDENIIALKAYDFSPIFSNSWSNEVSSKMKEKLLFNRFIVQFKSNKPDPADGKYPVNLLEVVDKKSITEEYVEGKLAIRYSDYYEAWINHEMKRIFDCKENTTVKEEKEHAKYIISSPMFKIIPNRRNKTSISSKHRFNIEAQPFTPNSIKNKPSTVVPSSLNSSFQYDSALTFTNGNVFSGSPAKSPDQPDSGEKAVLVASRNGKVSTPAKEAASLTQRVKRGLEVTSPLSKRKMLQSGPVSPDANAGQERLSHKLQACSLAPYPGYMPALNYPFSSAPDGPETQMRHMFAAGRGRESASPPVFSGHGSPSNHDLAVEHMAPCRPSSPKSYPIFNYPMPFVPPSYSFQPMTFPYMFQAAMMKQQMCADPYGSRYNFGQSGGNQDNVTIVQFKANDKSH